MWSKFRISLWIILTALLLQGNSAVILTSAQNSVQFTETALVNHFPDELVFNVDATHTGGEIIRAKFVYTSENYYTSSSFTKEELEFQPGNKVSLEYTLDTRNITTPPMMTYSFYWEVVDAEGSKYQSEPVTIRYEDTRFNWLVLENENIGVWYHDRPGEFGESIFEVAAAAVETQRELFQTDLDYQIRLVICNSAEEFAAWHNIAYDWVGGETFSDYGITVQIVGEGSYQDSWIYGVIPHEISHLYFNQVTHNPTVSVPVWLNEGVAQYNEFITHEWEESQVNDAAIEGRIIPLSSLANGFGAFDVDRVRLSYYEALSAVTYLVETFGNQGLDDLLAAYKDGKGTDEAFNSALGISAETFEYNWAESVGAEGYVIPTAFVMPTFRPSPTMYVQATPIPTSAAVETSAPFFRLSIVLLLCFGIGVIRLASIRKRKKADLPD